MVIEDISQDLQIIGMVPVIIQGIGQEITLEFDLRVGQIGVLVAGNIIPKIEQMEIQEIGNHIIQEVRTADPTVIQEEIREVTQVDISGADHEDREVVLAMETEVEVLEETDPEETIETEVRRSLLKDISQLRMRVMYSHRFMLRTRLLTTTIYMLQLSII